MIGDKLKQLRKLKGLTRKQLSILADVSPDTVDSLERGNPYRKSTLKAVCKALGVSVEDFKDELGRKGA